MKKSKRLEVVDKVALWREQKQQHELKLAQQKLQKQTESFNQLSGYQQEYQARSPEAGRQAISVASIQNFSRFMRDLSQACLLQGEQLQQADTAFHAQEQQWRQLHARTRRMESLVERAEKVEQRQQEALQELEIADNWASKRISTKNDKESS